MLEITVQTRRWFDSDSTGDSLYREMYCEPATETFESIDKAAAWLVMEGFDWQYDHSPEENSGAWRTPQYESALSGLHEVRVASRGENMTPQEWDAVFNHLMSVKTA